MTLDGVLIFRMVCFDTLRGEKQVLTSYQIQQTLRMFLLLSDPNSSGVSKIVLSSVLLGGGSILLKLQWMMLDEDSDVSA